MRKVIEPQMKLGQVDIASIRFDPRSRDEIPQLLMGLQSIWLMRFNNSGVKSDMLSLRVCNAYRLSCSNEL